MYNEKYGNAIRCTVAIFIVIVILTVTNLSPANLAFAKARATQTSAIALQHVPTGTADLHWNSTDNTLIVTVTANGLAPNSTHAAALQQDLNNAIFNCNNPHHAEKTIYSLNILKADKFGNVVSASTTIAHVITGIPDQGWSITILSGSPSSQKRIACGDIVPGGIPHGIAPPLSIMQEKLSSTSTPTTKDQLVHVFLGGSADPNQSVMGNATLSLTNNTLTVTIWLGQLVANAKYIAQIDNGTCQAQGPMAYPLNAFTADNKGQNSSLTIVQPVTISSISKTPWYITVYEAPPNNRASQAGLDPIACGNFSTVIHLSSPPVRGTPQNSQAFVPCCKH